MGCLDFFLLALFDVDFVSYDSSSSGGLGANVAGRD